MKKDDYSRWFSDRLLRQNRLLIAAIAAMIGLGLVATLFEAGIFAVILHIGFMCPWIRSFVVAFGILGVILFLTYLHLPNPVPSHKIR